MSKSLMSKPWLHFVLVGVLLYLGQGWLSEPEIEIIELPSAEELAQMRGQWLRTTGRPITDEQLQKLIDSNIDQEILFREAIKREWHLDDPVVRDRLIRDMRFLDPDTTLGDDRLVKQAMQLSLHENDLVVRRRLIQMMELAAFAPVRREEPPEAELQARYDANAEEFMTPALLGFQQIFASQDKHQDSVAVAKDWLQSLDGGDEQLGDPFLHGLSFKGLSPRQVERYFGSYFSEQLFNLASASEQSAEVSQQWQGPLQSSYGAHLVKLTHYQAPAPKAFSSVREQLLADWRREREQEVLRELLDQLRQNYKVGS